MKARSINGKSPEEILTALNAAIGDGFIPTLAIVFISIKQDRKAVCEILAAQDIDVFGATSCGEFVDGHQSKGEIAILLMDLSRDSYAIVFEDMGARSIQAVAKQVASSAITERENSHEILIKSPMNIDYEENALVMDLEMKEGETFWFSVPPDFDIVAEIIDEAKEVKNAAGADADALLVFSCAGREPALGPLVTMENEGLAEVWKSPMAGFFTYGEFGRAKNGKQHIHSTACSWVALKEK